MGKYSIKTLGCKVNQFETEAIGLSLQQKGWEKAAKGDNADLCIINTCTVTGKASLQSRQTIRSIIKNNPGAKVIVTGCYAQTEADEIKKIEGVHSIISHAEKYKIPEMVGNVQAETFVSTDCNSSCTETEFKAPDIDVHGSRTRPFLKIQDGCNSFCTYCIVPHTRGRSRSMAPDLVLKRLKALGENGYKEIVLTGIHIGHWGEDLEPPFAFADLLKRIEKEKPVTRIRLSSIEPGEVTDEIISLFTSSDIFCNHFHIPLQSGDDNTLRRMHRPYDSDFFRKLVERIHSTAPDAAIGVDVLTGFPGETDEEFNNTYTLIETLPISHLHVFPFSPRKKTPAATFPDQITDDVKKQRTEKMRLLGDRKKRAFLESLKGKTLEVLIENSRDKKTGKLKGLSSNYAVVQTEGPDSLKNSVTDIRIESVTPEYVSGSIVSD